ncbi:MAG: hypothetical protein LBV64_05135 [Mediterranea sp.]|nr:hypothetical protein [Mediterranea sp.]
MPPSYSPYGTGIRWYATGILPVCYRHNSRMVYTKHPVWYIPYDSFAIYQRGNYFIYENRVLTEAGEEMPMVSEIKYTNIISMLRL